MNVPSYDTFIAAERVTAAKLNKNLRDSGNFFKNTPFAWAYVGAAYTGTTNVWADSLLDTEKADNDNMFSPGNGGKLVVQTPGWYHVEGGGRWATNADGYRGVRLRQNGVDLDVVYSPGLAGIGVTLRGSSYAYCVANDAITVGHMFNSTTVTALSVNQPHYSFLRARWVAS